MVLGAITVVLAFLILAPTSLNILAMRVHFASYIGIRLHVVNHYMYCDWNITHGVDLYDIRLANSSAVSRSCNHFLMVPIMLINGHFSLYRAYLTVHSYPMDNK